MCDEDNGNLEIDLDELTTPTLVGMVRDFHCSLSEARNDVKYYKERVEGADARSLGNYKMAQEWEEKYRSVIAQSDIDSVAVARLSGRKSAVDQLVAIAEGPNLSDNQALALCGALYDLGATLKAIKIYRQRFHVGLKDAKEVMVNWKVRF